MEKNDLKNKGITEIEISQGSKVISVEKAGGQNDEIIPTADFTQMIQNNADYNMENEVKRKTVAILTLGCKVNQYESEAIREIFLKDGYEEVSNIEEADVYVVNTCTVTNMAAKKSRQMLSRGKKKNPGCVVVAVGCYVQREHEKLKEMTGIDILIGNNYKKEILNYLDEYYKSRATIDKVEEGYNKPTYEDLKVSQRHDKSRATIKIQDGCNQFCTYCVIPYARGKVRSRRPGMVVEEIKGLVEQGYHEFIITGIHLTSYGIDFSDRIGLIDLLEEIDKIQGVHRIRLGSLEPRLVTEDFSLRIKKLKHLCPHFHLSMQSGSDGVLERMNRRYRTKEFAAGVEQLRKVYPNPAITTDVIVGFPGETEEEFVESLDFVQKISFADLHVFKYSKRAGTKAAEMNNQVSEPVKHERSMQMIEAGLLSKNKYLESFINKEVEVLLEEKIEIKGQFYMTGHTREYIKIYYPEDQVKSGQEMKVIPISLFEDGMLAIDR